MREEKGVGGEGEDRGVGLVNPTPRGDSMRVGGREGGGTGYIMRWKGSC